MYRPGEKRLTPVMKQYRDAKLAYPDAILFFRLGDFYEMFNDDAVVAARELQLTLTSRNKKSPDPVPMAGIPCHAAHNYVSKLVARGHKVAICDQIGDPKKIKGIVPRKVVRVVSPGVVTDERQLDAGANNFLCAIDVQQDDDGGRYFGFARLDLSTGTLEASLLNSSAMAIAEVARAEARETVLSPDAADVLGAAIAATAVQTTCRQDDELTAADATSALDQNSDFPLAADVAQQHHPVAALAAARALRFVMRSLPGVSLPITAVGHHDPRRHVRLDESTQRHLELTRSAAGLKDGTLLSVVDRTVTALGARLLRRHLLEPLLDVAEIRRRHDGVEQLVQNPGPRKSLRTALKRTADLKRLAIRAHLGEATPRDLGSIRDTLAIVPEARDAVAAILASGLPTSDTSKAESPWLNAKVDVLPNLAATIKRALMEEPPTSLKEGSVIAPGYDADLDRARKLRDEGQTLLKELEGRLRKQSKIPTLKIKHTRAFGWYIEVSKAHVDKVPEVWQRRQTLTTAERYLNDELSELAVSLESAEEDYQLREKGLLTSLVSEVANAAPGLVALADALAQWDVTAGLAEVAHERDYCRPTIDDSQLLRVEDGRHPVVELLAASNGFVPNDVDLDPSADGLWLITGPNMAGKSTFMRQVALITILAQAGSFVPAKSAHIGVVDRVLSRVGASDNLARGESTFMVEMRETATILRDATPRSLVIVDEVGRGTSTFDGLSIAWAVAAYLHDRVKCRTLFATHYHELTALEDDKDHVCNVSVSARQHRGKLVFLHRIEKGAVSRSYGIAVARLAGLPETVLDHAEQILDLLEKGRQDTSPQLSLFLPTGTTKRTAPTQEPEEIPVETEVAAMLRTTNVNELTPLAALTLLDELQRKLKTT